MKHRLWRAVLFALTLLVGTGLTGPLAWAHKASDAYLTLKIDPAAPDRIDGQWDIALRDLEYAVGLDRDDDGQLTWGEVRAAETTIAGHVLSRLSLSADNRPCPLAHRELLIDRHSDGAYAVLRFAARCPGAPTTLDIDYRLLFDQDRQHKGLLKLQGLTPEVLGAVFSAEQPGRRFSADGNAAASRWRVFVEYVEQGIRHIWIGVDHILFLLSLLLPAVLLRVRGEWRQIDRFRPGWWEVLKVVTAFTVAHSLTLSAASLGWLTLPSRLVESAIALSVVLAALNNVRPLVGRGRWLMAFGFGLIHGFGFASVLADLGLPESALVLALLAFNVGVELGQIVIVAAFLPVAYVLRGTRFYRQWVLVGGSLTIATVAALWFAERALDLKFMPF